VARALAATLVVSLLAGVPGAGGSRAQTPHIGGTVAMLPQFYEEPPCLNPVVKPCVGPSLAIRSVLLGAYSVGPDSTYQEQLVSGVDHTTTSPFTLTYHIRPEARWSDGVRVSARDFVFTYRAFRDHAPPEFEDPHRTRIRYVRELDARTVRVVLRSRFGFWRDLFNVVLPEHALRGENIERLWLDGIVNPKTGTPIGSGPFLVSRLDRGRQLTLVRNPRYWGPHRAYLDRIVIRFVEGAETLDGAAIAGLLRRADVDIATRVLGSAKDLISELRRVPGTNLRFRPGIAWEHVDIRVGQGGHPALKSKLVRQALAYAIDRAALVRALFGEAAPQPLDSLVYLSDNRFYLRNWSEYRHSPDRARRLLERAGCRRGADGIYSCAGARLTLRFVARGSNAYRVQTLDLVRAQLQQVGIEVMPTYASQDAHNQILTSGDFDLTLFAWFQTPSDDSGARGVFGCGASQNDTGYCQRLVTRDLNQAELILSAAERARVLNRADAQLARDVPVIPLFQIPFVIAVRSTIRGFVVHPSNPTWNAENWWLER
jgi:ABC-type transport system substrate-binding protein